SDRDASIDMTCEILRPRRRRARDSSNGNGAVPATGKPRQVSLDSIVEMDQHIFAGPDAAFDEPRRQRADPLVKLAVGPAPRRRVEWGPDQERVVTPALAAHPQQPRHIEAREGADNAWCCA